MDLGTSVSLIRFPGFADLLELSFSYCGGGKTFDPSGGTTVWHCENDKGSLLQQLGAHWAACGALSTQRG